MLPSLILMSLMGVAPASSSVPSPTAGPISLESMPACGTTRSAAIAQGFASRDEDSEFVLRRRGDYPLGSLPRAAILDVYLTIDGDLSASVLTIPFPEDQRRRARGEAASDAALLPGAGPMARDAFTTYVLPEMKARFGEPVQIEAPGQGSRPNAVFRTVDRIAVALIDDAGSVTIRTFCRAALGKTADIPVNAEGLSYERILDLLAQPGRMEPATEEWSTKVSGGTPVK